ncbi:hypothetical protein DUI87_07905 [Hirundo rustica rustica]|uniref:PB1 domain-containing protein n=1 Tax=Hirundo rustica rustica TaxID=333673 RepID=A0A3M0KQZ9_HIRRU|nr:hypothetical protein DUI87_07905 [Hirundo rustica rustica]
MNRSFNKSQTLRYLECSAVEVKSKFGAEFRRFSLDRYKPGKFEDFYKLILHIHHIANLEVMIGYADVHGDLLPINNDDNFFKAVSSAHPLLRVFIQRQDEVCLSVFKPKDEFKGKSTTTVIFLMVISVCIPLEMLNMQDSLFRHLVNKWRKLFDFCFEGKPGVTNIP